MALPPSTEFCVEWLTDLEEEAPSPAVWTTRQVAEVSFRSFPVSGLTARVAKRDTSSLQSFFRAETQLWKTNHPAAAKYLASAKRKATSTPITVSFKTSVVFTVNQGNYGAPSIALDLFPQYTLTSSSIQNTRI